MAAKIEVEKIDQFKFRVRISEAGSETTHDVTMKQDDYARLTGGKIEPEELVRRSFEFLLEREPKESILSSLRFVSDQPLFSGIRTRNQTPATPKLVLASAIQGLIETS